jgi:hypothetical protein
MYIVQALSKMRVFAPHGSRPKNFKPSLSPIISENLRSFQHLIVSLASTGLHVVESLQIFQVFNWMGRFSNVIERARAAEVAATILFKKVTLQIRLELAF